MKYQANLVKISNAYYNKGLERAGVSDLSGAAGYLKRALLFNKYCTDARNLLGLIFYETGETADALVQWVISTNLQPEGNIAREYLFEIQKKPGVLAEASSVVKKFNHALYLAQTGSEDFALVELGDITKTRPNYIKAQLLLAILYMQEGDHIKAGRALMKVLDIDCNHPLGTKLMDEVKHATGKAEVERARLENAYMHRELADDVVIIPVAKSGKGRGRPALIAAAGIITGLFIFYILLLPGIRRSYNIKLNDNIVENAEELSRLNAAYNSLSNSYDELSKDYEEVSRRLDAYEKENLDFTTAYEMLDNILALCEEGNYVEAAGIYLSINRENITTEPLVSQLLEADRLMINSGFDAITQLGTDQWNGGNKELAEEYYRMALEIKPDDPEAMYLLARLLQSEDRAAEANEIFDKIVGEHPESPYADRAVTARGY